MSGTVNISRDIWQDAAFKQQPFTEREAFMWMVMEASWKPREKRIGTEAVQLERGQLAASIRFMAEAWGWQKSTVDRFLKRLKNRDMIGTASGTGCTIITVSKYNEYQSKPNASGTSKSAPTGRQRDSGGTNENKDEIREYTEEEPKGSFVISSDPVHANDLSEAVAIYNTAAEHAGWPKVAKMTPRRNKALKARIKDCGGIDGWRDALRRAYASDFCRNDWNGFNLDSIISQKNFTGLMEGKYDNRTRNNTASQGRENRPDPALANIARLAGLG